MMVAPAHGGLMQPIETIRHTFSKFLNTHTGSSLPVYWFGMALVILVFDYRTGPFIQFPITYILPVSFATWYSGLKWGLLLATVLPLVRLYFTTLWIAPWSFTDSAINAAIRIAVLVGFAILINRVSQQTKKLSYEVEALEGILPTCGLCKKVRDEEGNWHTKEDYINKDPGTRLYRRFCPKCGEQCWNTAISKSEKAKVIN